MPRKRLQTRGPASGPQAAGPGGVAPESPAFEGTRASGRVPDGVAGRGLWR